MPFVSKMISFWKNLFRRRQVERDLNDELQAYVEEMAERKMQAGVPPETAREAALLELGGIERIKDLVRQQRVGLGNLQRAGVTIVVAIVAFVSGAGAAVGAMRWNTAAPVAPAVVASPRASGIVPDPSLPVLQGRVVDKVTGEPIPNVEVGLQAFAPMRRYTFTDDKGRFGFTNPPAQGFQLQAGKERWFLSGSGQVNPSFNFPPVDRFSMYVPTNVVVKDKDGEVLEGERHDLKGIVSSDKNVKLVDVLQRRRSFRYSSGIIELPATNLQPGGRMAAVTR